MHWAWKWNRLTWIHYKTKQIVKFWKISSHLLNLDFHINICFRDGKKKQNWSIWTTVRRAEQALSMNLSIIWTYFMSMTSVIFQSTYVVRHRYQCPVMVINTHLTPSKSQLLSEFPQSQKPISLFNRTLSLGYERFLSQPHPSVEFSTVISAGTHINISHRAQL